MVRKGQVWQKVICPFCLRDSKGKIHKITSANGLTSHVRASHPNDYEEFVKNRKKYISEYACDKEGHPTNRRDVPIGDSKEEIDEIVSDTGGSEFTHVPISVIPDISNIEDIDLDSILDKHTQDDGKTSTGKKSPDANTVSFVGDQRFVESPESVAFDECVDISAVFWSIPSFIWGPHLAVEPNKINSFARQLHRYCIKKDIDPSEWFFDEFGLVLVSVGMLASLKSKHTAHKKEQGAVSKSVLKDQHQDTTYVKE